MYALMFSAIYHSLTSLNLAELDTGWDAGPNAECRYRVASGKPFGKRFGKPFGKRFGKPCGVDTKPLCHTSFCVPRCGRHWLPAGLRGEVVLRPLLGGVLRQNVRAAAMPLSGRLQEV